MSECALATARFKTRLLKLDKNIEAPTFCDTMTTAAAAADVAGGVAAEANVVVVGIGFAARHCCNSSR